MSLAIDVDRVSDVLLADGWHTVANNSFAIDSYEFLWNGDLMLGGGQDKLVPAAGFSFTDTQLGTISGPLTSVLAVRLESNPTG